MKFYLIAGAILITSAVSMFFYVKHLRLEIEVLQAQNVGYEKALAAVKDNLKLREQAEIEKKKIDSLNTPDDFNNYFNKLRSKANQSGYSNSNDGKNNP